MRNGLIELIQESVGGCAKYWAEAIADHLLTNGVIAAPLKEGDVVFAVLRDFDGEDVIVEYEVSSVALISGKWWVFDKHGERFEVGDELCLLTREEAEKALAEMEGKR